jgi:magnesium-transporting ATPase (P-type)
MIPNEQNNNNNKDQDKTQEIEKIEKIHEIQKEEEEIKAHSSGMYGLDIIQIEKLMGYYKERGANFLDLETIKEFGGPEGIMSKLKTDPKTGISSTENRENDFGSNKVFIEPVPPFCSYVCEALEDLMVRILIAAAIVQIILGVTLGEDPTKDWIDGLSIIIAVLVVTLVGSITNYQKETKFHELNAVQNEGTIYKVIRNGVPETMKSDDILVGDLINIMVGDIMPSDIILIEGNGIKMDESSLTGESDSLRKEPYEKCVLIKNENSSSKVPSPLMLSGTNCVEGTGFGIVLAVGDHCQKGIIRRTVDNAQENSQTPLEKKLEDIAEKIGLFGMIAGIVTLVALTIRFIIHYLKNDKKYRKDSAMKDIVNAYLMNFPNYLYNSEIKNEANIHLTNPSSEISANVLNIIMLCVSIIVVAIPEGLPLAVTLSLAFSIKKLMDFKNLVRKMHACETMGGANYICTDKTGTLTKNEMNVFRILTAKGQIELKETIEDNETKALDKNKNIKNELKIREQHDIYFKNSNYWDQLRIAVALNVDGQIKELENPDINGDTESC